jgi:elongation factor 1-gamma
MPSLYVPHLRQISNSNYSSVSQLQTTFHERQLRALKTIDAHLATRTFLVGERITLADIAVASQVQRAAQITLDPTARAQVPNVIRHMETVINQPKFKGVYDPTVYAEKLPQFVPPPKEKKEPKAAAPAPAPAAPKAPKAKAAEEEDDDEPAAPPAPKVHNPLDDLPKSKFNLEDWKRAWSNKDTRGPDGALEWFYQKCV